MGKPDTHGAPFSDSISLHSNVGESSVTTPYLDDDAPEIDIDDLPPNYSDALDATDSSEAAPMLSPGGAMDGTVRPIALDSKVITDKNTGAQSWIAKSVEDPDMLEKYIRQLSTTPPRPYMKIVGTHSESSRNSQGKQEKRTITDFDVMVELTPYLFADAQYRKSWSYIRTVDEGEKVHRGTILAKRGERASQSIEIGSDAKPTLREWCHRFAASSAGLKRFTFRRQLVGFDEKEVVRRLEELVRRTNYRGHFGVQLVTKDAQIEFYNDAKINHWRLTTWIQWLFILTLTIIFSWPYLFFRTKKWEVIVADWPFSRLDESGNKQYVSISEDQWYNMWAQAINRAVLEKRQKILDQSDLRRAHEPEPAFDTGNATADGALGLFRASMNAMNEVNRQLGWGGDS